MSPARKFWILNQSGHPFSEHIDDALRRLISRLRRHLPPFCDKSSLIEILEEAGCRLERREREVGRIERLPAYAWVTLRSVAPSSLRRNAARLACASVPFDDTEAAVHARPSTSGTPEQVERAVLLAQILARLTPQQRLICDWKKAGLSSQEIAHLQGSPAAAVDAMFSRIRHKVRKLAGVQPTPNSPSARRAQSPAPAPPSREPALPSTSRASLNSRRDRSPQVHPSSPVPAPTDRRRGAASRVPTSGARQLVSATRQAVTPTTMAARFVG